MLYELTGDQLVSISTGTDAISTPPPRVGLFILFADKKKGGRGTTNRRR